MGDFAFTLKTASQRSGVGIHSIRAWERRYGAVKPGRDAQGRRVFDEAQLERLILLGRLVRGGHRISTIAGHSTRRLATLAAAGDEDGGTDTAHEALVERILAAATSNDDRSCHRMIASAIMTLEPLTAVADVLSPLMARVGEEWATGRLSVAQEHMVTAVLKRHLLSVMETLRLADTGPCIVLATLSGERHELGALFAAFLAACRGHRIAYLGPDLPGRELAQIAADLDARIVGVSLVHLPADGDVEAELDVLARQRPPGAEIWVGGAVLGLRRGIAIPAACDTFHSIRNYWQRLAEIA